MSTGAVVFLGPTLPLSKARGILPDAHYLPPVAQGDVLRALRMEPRCIALIDGVFESQPAVWHKEILLALEQGVHVFGAASMGALRAAELADLGMVGVGAVYEAYRDGSLEDDDEVAVAHGPAEHGFRPLSEAMVDLRDLLDAAAYTGVITTATAQRLIEIGKQLHYPERSLRRLLEIGRAAALPPEELEALLPFQQSRGAGRKARDATALLAHLGSFLASDPAPLRAQCRVERTVFLDALRAEVEREVRQAEDPVLRDLTLDAAHEQALLRLLARREAQRLRFDVPDQRVQEVADRYRTDRGLHDRAATLRWLADRGLDEDQFAELMHDRALCEALGFLFASELTAEAAHETRLASRWDSPQNGGADHAGFKE